MQYGLVLSKPLYLLRVFKHSILELLGHKKFLYYLDICITYRCNAKCKHCFTTMLEKQDVPLLSVEEYARIAKEFLKEGVLHFCFQGGEIFLREDWEDAIRAFKPNKTLISVTTNGLLINEEVLNRFKKVGVDIIVFSLDSFEAVEHDSFRGINGLRDKVFSAISLAKKKGFRVIINTVVTHKTVRSENIMKIYDFVLKEKLLLNVLAGAPIGNWNERADLFLNDDDRDYLFDLYNKSSRIRRDLFNSYKKPACNAVERVMYMSPYGDVFPCGFLHFKLGNLREEPLSNMRKKALDIGYFNGKHPYCYAAEDEEFIKKHFYSFSQNKFPLLFEDLKK